MTINIIIKIVIVFNSSKDVQIDMQVPISVKKYPDPLLK